jgi:hypothetical protein
MVKKYRMREENEKFMATIEEDGKAVDLYIAPDREAAMAARDAAQDGGWKDFSALKKPEGSKKKKGAADA